MMKGRGLIRYVSLYFKNLNNIMPGLNVIIMHFCNFVLKNLVHYDLSGKVIIKIFGDVKVRYFSGLSFEQILFRGYERYPSYIPKRGDITIDVGGICRSILAKSG